MKRYKLIKILVVFFVHVVWCMLIFIYRPLLISINKSKNNSYNLNILFSNAEGVKAGTSVNYRGVGIGTVSSINLYTDYVIVKTHIKSSQVLIPLNAYVKVYKTIFMADTVLHMYNPNKKYLNLPKIVAEEKACSFYQSSNSTLNYDDSYCKNNDFIYGFEGADFNNLIDVFIRLSIQLDNLSTIDNLNNIIQKLDKITSVTKQQILEHLN
uniref:Mce/MlaD domain-containing protein n=1 Tax=Apophlaea sinclairii TaxID=212746 RepID=A0A1C9CBM2_9FLOR|nr:hypothetical protein Apop_082 [Apophlaea sinclairii]AOM65772.1 hypothetical protein Apop_082 [Apophlaea sinclairii]